MMIENYLKIAWRRLFKNRLYSLINSIGLAVGMCVCMFILLYTWEELNYDRFHQKADNIWRVTRQYKDVPRSTTTPWPLADLAKNELAQVGQSTRFLKYWFDPVLSVGEEGYYENDAYFIDQHFFEIFDYPLLYGQVEQAFTAPNSILLNKSMAQKYFGDNNPIGQTITYNAEIAFQVTGVFDDLPGNSHFNFRYLLYTENLSEIIEMPLEGNWGAGLFHTYLRTIDDVAGEQMGNDLTKLVHNNSEDRGSFALQPMTGIHLHSDYAGELQANSDIRFVYLLIGIAFIILLLACVNYTNLSTSLFSKQIREIGVRKVIGAQQKQILWQLLIQSILVSVMAFVLAVFLFETSLPWVRQFTGQSMYLSNGQHLIFLGGMSFIALLVGLLSGLYPSLQALRQPLHLIKGNKAKINKQPGMWRWLVAMQFMLAILLLFNTFLIQRQLGFLQEKQLGFSEEQLVVLPVREETLLDKPQMVKTHFQANSAVKAVSTSATLPGGRVPATTITPPAKTGKEAFKSFLYFVDEAFVPTMDMEFLAGQNFRASAEQEERPLILINEQASLAMGWNNPEEALGQAVGFWGQDYLVEGVVKDFHFETTRKAIQPLILMPDMSNCDGLIVRLSSGQLNENMASLEKSWQNIAGNQPFTYYFLDEKLDQFYKAEQKYSRIMSGASFLAILIACLGLFGLTSFATEKRVREIGIRKVLGASTNSLLWLFNREFLRWVLLAILLAAPISWWIAKQWLQFFAYRADISWTIFLWTALCAITIACLTVSFQSWRASLINPVQAIKRD